MSNPKLGKRISNILMLPALLLVSMEVGSRVILSTRFAGRLPLCDAYWRVQWIRRRQAPQSAGRLNYNQPQALYHPTRGWALRPGFKGVLSGTIVSTNSKALRATPEYPYERSPGKRRILVLGDSFTFGTGVSDDETYSRRLECALPDTEVLNLGVEGYGHDQMLLYLKEEGMKYNPDLVILGFVYLDVYHNIWTFFSYAKPKFDVRAGGLKLSNVPVPPPDRVLAEQRYHLELLDIMEMLEAQFRWSFGQNDAEARSVTGAILREVVATVRKGGAVPVFVYLPVWDELDPRGRRPPALIRAVPPIAEREQFLQTLCHDNNVPCLMLRPRFMEEVGRGTDFNARSHWNARAHEFGALEIRSFLLRENLAPTLTQAAGQPGSHQTLDSSKRAHGTRARL